MSELIHLVAAEGPNGRMFPGDIMEFWWGLAASLIVFGLIFWKAGPLIKAALSKGQADAEAEATAAEAQIAESKARIAAATAELGDANAESERIIAEAHATANQLRVDSANRTQQLVNDMWAKAQTDVASMKTQAGADIQSEVAAQAVGAAEQVVRSNLDPGRQADLIEDYIAGLRTS